eukprot:992844-Rhodomonas_salina.2
MVEGWVWVQAHQTLITTNQVQLHLEPVAVAEGGRSSERRGAEDVAVHVRVKYGSGHPIPRNDFRRVLTMFEGETFPFSLSLSRSLSLPALLPFCPRLCEHHSPEYSTAVVPDLSLACSEAARCADGREC